MSQERYEFANGGPTPKDKPIIHLYVSRVIGQTRLEIIDSEELRAALNSADSPCNRCEGKPNQTTNGLVCQFASPTLAVGGATHIQVETSGPFRPACATLHQRQRRKEWAV